MKNVIEQIRKIKGVVTVEPFGTNGAVVLFEIEEQKPKSLTPKELVDGKIYVDEDERYPNIFRFKVPKYCTIKYASYSRLFLSGEGFELEQSSILPKGIHEASKTEAQILIRAEVANDFFFELKDVK